MNSDTSLHMQSTAGVFTHAHSLLWPLLCSIMLHVLLAWVVPNIQLDAIKKPDLLNVELIKKEAPLPTPPEPTPEPPAPEPVKPTPISKPEPIKKVKPAPVPEAIEAIPEPVTPPPSQPAPPTRIIAVEPTPEAPTNPMPPVTVVTPPPPPPPSGPSTAELDDARNRYGHSLWGAIEKHKQYPKIAQMRGWQGEVIVELLLDGNGKLKSKKILTSSGYDVLDKQALEMIEKAAPYPTPPEVLRSNQFSIKVPVPFRLEG